LEAATGTSASPPGRSFLSLPIRFPVSLRVNNTQNEHANGDVYENNPALNTVGIIMGLQF